MKHTQGDTVLVGHAPWRPGPRHAAFADLVASYEVVGNPEKRAAFDDFGDHEDEGLQQGCCLVFCKTRIFIGSVARGMAKLKCTTHGCRQPEWIDTRLAGMPSLLLSRPPPRVAPSPRSLGHAEWLLMLLTSHARQQNRWASLHSLIQPMAPCGAQDSTRSGSTSRVGARRTVISTASALGSFGSVQAIHCSSITHKARGGSMTHSAHAP